MTSFTSFRVVNAPGVTMYRKGLEPVSVVAAPLPPAIPPSPLQSKTPPRGQRVERTLADVRLHADRGEWISAVQCCEQLLRNDSLNSLVHFYHALVLEQISRHSEAELALRRAIYLDRQSVLPHYYLGLLLQSHSDPRQAARSFENAITLLESRSDSDVFADADGITVAEMKKLAKMQLEVLQV
jgi:tetratricopeptide (TPR) repeat protein